jgi:hypothetical protein
MPQPDVDGFVVAADNIVVAVTVAVVAAVPSKAESLLVSF